MNKQQTQDEKLNQSVVEDLTADEDSATAVKGGSGVKTVRFRPGKDLQHQS